MISMLLAAALAASPEPTPSPAAPRDPNCVAAVGFTGTLCAPAGTGRHPAILLLGGSEGGDSLARLAARQSHDGYVAASIAYFGAPGLPPSLQDVPVETIGAALAAIARRPDVDAGRIAILGASKGGEFALLAAATYPQIHAVIADVPSPFAWQGIPQGPDPTSRSSWTVGGKPLPYVAFGVAFDRAFEQAFTTHQPLRLRPAYDAAMTNTAAVDRAFFALEKIAGPVLFLSAGEDQIWNSAAQADDGLRYLQRMHHPYADAAQNYPQAGHLFLFATADRPFVDAPFAGGLTLALGGTPAANVSAGVDAWARIGSFLDAAFAKPHAAPTGH